MLPAERINRIAEILGKDGSVKIDALAKEFNISEMTVRRDLEKCETMGMVDRCYGGAILKRELKHEQSVMDRESTNMDAKQKIADYCARFVDQNDVVYLDAGTTTRCIAHAIARIPGITVVTNDIFVAQELVDSKAQVHLLGGMLQKSSGSTIGETVSRALEQMRFRIAFIGAAAISDEMDAMTPTLEKTFLRRLVCSISNFSFLVVDSTKFRTQSMYRINSLADYSGVVTDAEFTEAEEQLIRKKNITIMKVE